MEVNVEFVDKLPMAWSGMVDDRFAAMTIGNTIYWRKDKPIHRRSVAHELRHAEQWSEDRFFLPKYIWHWFRLGRGRMGYENNPYELDAKEASFEQAYLEWADEIIATQMEGVAGG